MPLRPAAFLALAATLLAGPPAWSQAAPEAGPDFGDDSGRFARDGECDDRRFTGPGMAAALGWSETGRDASDCRALFDAGWVRLWDPVQAQAATQCAAIDWGDDGSRFANDGQCDDPRFEGLGSASLVVEGDTRADASDCRRLCEFGAVALRDY